MLGAAGRTCATPWVWPSRSSGSPLNPDRASFLGCSRRRAGAEALGGATGGDPGEHARRARRGQAGRRRRGSGWRGARRAHRWQPSRRAGLLAARLVVRRAAGSHQTEYNKFLTVAVRVDHTLVADGSSAYCKRHNARHSGEGGRGDARHRYRADATGRFRLPPGPAEHRRGRQAPGTQARPARLTILKPGVGSLPRLRSGLGWGSSR
jgi:hypothetical protein